MPRKFFNGIDLQNQRGINAATPTTSTDIANKAYVDGLANGKAYKDAVRVASTTNVNISSPGSIINGVTLVTGNSVLLKDQTDATQNGIWVFATSSTAMTRRGDADTSAKMVPSTTVVASEGSSLPDREWTLSTDGPITLGSTNLTFVLSGANSTYTAGNGLTLTGSDFSVGQGTGIVVNADDVAIDTAVVPRKYSTNIGNGASTTITVTHNLGTRDVVVGIRDSATFEAVEADDIAATTNTVTLTFAVAPANNAYRATVIG